MADHIKVSVSGIRRDRERILEETVGIRDEVQRLYEEMQALGQTWEGTAWQVFQAQVAADVENMQQVGEKLSVYLSHMEYAEKEYHSCENQVRGMINGL